jgi:hypothetical protein
MTCQVTELGLVSSVEELDACEEVAPEGPTPASVARTQCAGFCLRPSAYLLPPPQVWDGVSAVRKT